MSYPRRNTQIQSAIITKLKSITSLIDALNDAGSSLSEIREDQWQGTEFIYPNIRVRMISNSPEGDTAYCPRCEFTLSIMVFSQGYSSLEADTLAGIIASYLNKTSFSIVQTILYTQVTNIIPAIRSDRNTWRAECLIRGTASFHYILPTTIQANPAYLNLQGKPAFGILDRFVNVNPAYLNLQGMPFGVYPTGTPPVGDWWLAGGIDPGDVYGAYAAVGASSYENSKINLANPGFATLLDGVNYPEWGSGDGWRFYDPSATYLYLPSLPVDLNTSIIAKYTNKTHPYTYMSAFLFGNYAIRMYFYEDYGKSYYYHQGFFGSIIELDYEIGPENGIMGVRNGLWYDCGVFRVMSITGELDTYYPFCIGASNFSFSMPAVPSSYFTGNITSIAIYQNNPLTEAQFSAVAAAMP